MGTQAPDNIMTTSERAVCPTFSSTRHHMTQQNLQVLAILVLCRFWVWQPTCNQLFPVRSIKTYQTYFKWLTPGVSCLHAKQCTWGLTASSQQSDWLTSVFIMRSCFVLTVVGLVTISPSSLSSLSSLDSTVFLSLKPTYPLHQSTLTSYWQCLLSCHVSSFLLVVSLFVWVSVLFSAVTFWLFDWLVRSPKWPVMCRVGCWNIKL